MQIYHLSYLIHGEEDAVNLEKKGTKMAALYELEVDGGQEAIVKLRLTNSAIFSEKLSPFGEYFDIVFKDRIREADEYYSGLLHKNLSPQEAAISRQAYAGEQVLSMQRAMLPTAWKYQTTLICFS